MAVALLNPSSSSLHRSNWEQNSWDSQQDPVATRVRPPGILVVDDDPSIVHLLKEFFLSQGYEVICGFDGQMAIQLAHQKLPDLIIMDVNMR